MHSLTSLSAPETSLLRVCVGKDQTIREGPDSSTSDFTANSATLQLFPDPAEAGLPSHETGVFMSLIHI